MCCWRLAWSRARRLVSFVAALDCADALLKQNEALFHVGQCAEPNLDRAGPAVESTQDFGLHIAHLLDQFFAEAAHVAV